MAHLRRLLDRAIGTEGHAATVVLLALILAVDAADKGAIGALAPTLKDEFDLSNFDIGMLAGAFSVVAAIATIPAGVLTDRVRRTALLAASLALWTVAMVVGGLATSFLVLLLSRLFLGVVTATANPSVASLTGDLYPRSHRARILGVIQFGELVGVGAGFVLVGMVVTQFSWRWVFFLLAALGAAIAIATARLPEPPRSADLAEGGEHEDDPVVRAVRDNAIEPNEENIVDEDPADAPLLTAMHDVVKVETNVVVIAASSIGYFFFAALRSFGVLFATGQYGLTNATASFVLPVVGVGAVAGVVAGGRIADALLERGVLNARIYVAIVGYTAATALFVPALLTTSLVVALPLLVLGAAGLAAPNPALDAVRLDVMHPRLWGRAESVRTLFRTIAEAVAPLLLGLLADHLAGGGHRGLQLTMLIVLPTLLANGLLLAFATRSYPHDVAAVLASTEPEARSA